MDILCRSIHYWHHYQSFGGGIWLFCRREVSTVKCCSYLTVLRGNKIAFSLRWYLNGMDMSFRKSSLSASKWWVAPHGSNVCALNYDGILITIIPLNTVIFMTDISRSCRLRVWECTTLQWRRWKLKRDCGSITVQLLKRGTFWSCDGTMCLSSNFSMDCERVDICGEWMECKLSAYPKYAEAKRQEKKGRKRDVDGAQSAAKRGRGRSRRYQMQRQSQA